MHYILLKIIPKFMTGYFTVFRRLWCSLPTTMQDNSLSLELRVPMLVYRCFVVYLHCTESAQNVYFRKYSKKYTNVHNGAAAAAVSPATKGCSF
jgi:hypothetical protein